MLFYQMFFYHLLDHLRDVSYYHCCLFGDACQSQYVRYHISKCTDDPVIESLVDDDDPDHGPVVTLFLNINVSKTKKMMIDFKRNPRHLPR